MRKSLESVVLLCLALLLSSGNRHSQSSADPQSGQLTLKLHSEQVLVNLDAPGTSYEKDASGAFTTLRFNRLNKLYIVTFHPQGLRVEERVSSVRRLAYHGDQLVYSGASEVYDPEGMLLQRTSWIEGKLDGPFQTYDHTGVLREERFYEKGLPVKQWTTRYEDGTLASQTQFPESYSVWEETRQQQDQTSVYLLTSRAATEVTESWFSFSGQKQRQRSSQARLGSDGLIRITPKTERYFDEQGRVSREIAHKGPKTLDQRVLTLADKEFYEDVHLLDGKEMIRRRYMRPATD